MDTATTLTQYGMMAEEHWRKFCPKMVAGMEAKGILEEMLLDAERKTKDELYDLTMQFQQQKMTAQQAHDRAWEIVRERYIFLPPEAE
jgi:hypothetical protein